MDTVELLGRTYTVVRSHAEFMKLARDWWDYLSTPREYPVLVDWDVRDTRDGYDVTEYYLYERDIRDAFGRIKEMLE